tara:strand:- start:1019 stop:2122 length:1104 start_codon:yes stop_codon:yes gene_type:complete
MAYIGTTPTSGDFVLLDSITTSATASYTMQRNSVNFEPQSANHMIVSLNGTIQAPVSSFTVSGSTLTFASALTSSDVIDFILVLGNVNDVGTATTVVDSAITKNKLNLISDSSSAGLTVKGDGSSVEGSIVLNCHANTHGIKLTSPDHSAGQSYELIFPTGNVTADKFLKVASVSGSGTTGIGQLSFADAGGGFVYVGGASVVNTNTSQVNVDSVFSSTYRNYRIFIEATSNTQSDDIRLKLRNSSGDISASTELYTVLSGINNSGSQQSGSQAQASYWRIFENTANQDNTDYPMGACEITIYAPNVSTDITHMTFLGSYKHSGGEERARYGSLLLNNQQAVTGLALVSSSGSINDAQIKVYGMVDS